MQPTATLNSQDLHNLTASEMLMILNAIDQRMKEAKKNVTTFDETDTMMFVFVMCTALAYTGLPTDALYWIGNVFWNGVDLLALKKAQKEWWDTHKHWNTRGAAGFNCFATLIMAASTAWSATATAGATPANIVIGGTAIAGAAVAAGAFSFSLAMLAGAIQSGVAAQLAQKRSTYPGLLNEKDNLLNENIFKKNKLEAKINKLKNTTTSREAIINETSRHQPKIEKLKIKLEKIESDINTLHSLDDDMLQHFSDKANSVVKKTKSKEEVLAVDLMLAEQKNIAALKRLDALACSMACVGSGLMAGALICPPAAIPLGIAAGVCLAAAAAIKIYQLTEKHALEKTVNHTSRNEREQVFLATAKNVADKSFKSAQEKLLHNYCNRRGLNYDDFQNDPPAKDKTIDLECKYQYAEENKTWSGFLNHQWKRGEIAITRGSDHVKSRFFTGRRREKHAINQTAPAT